mgnify:CR=1 FL=1
MACGNRTAHPRSRGEHFAHKMQVANARGSPPLARGTHVVDAWSKGHERLTPARAGNTGKGYTTHSGRAAHPRSRGEHQACSLRASRLIGSPPLARGTHSPPPPSSQRRRLIPARAGNTRLLKHLSRRAQAHPRSRGEHCLNRLDGFLFFRLTPARAGNTIGIGPDHRNDAAHPRSRGEHREPAAVGKDEPGSPPLARGTLPAGSQGKQNTRLTPARAGNTNGKPRQITRCQAHPRSRGEHLVDKATGEVTAGSPPLARGTPGSCWRLAGFRRLTPARAGNTGICMVLFYWL